MECRRKVLSYLLRNKSKRLLFPHRPPRARGRHRSRDVLQGRRLRKVLFAPKPSFGGKKRYFLRQWKSPRIGELSKAALRTLHCKVRAKMAEYRRRNSNVPFLANLLLCKWVLQRFVRRLSMS